MFSKRVQDCRTRDLVRVVAAPAIRISSEAARTAEPGVQRGSSNTLVVKVPVFEEAARRWQSSKNIVLGTVW